MYELWHWGSLEGFAMATHPGGCRDQAGNIQVFCDAVRHYLPQGEALMNGHGRVTGFFYPPPFALAMGGLAALGRSTALGVWVAGLVISTLGLFLLPQLHLFARSRATGVVHALLFVGAMPVIANFYWGQVSVLCVLLAVAALVLYDADHRYACAILLGLATAIKIYPGVFALVFVLQRDFRTAAQTALIAFVLMVLLPLPSFGTLGIAHFYSSAFSELGDLVRVTPYAYYGPNVISLVLTGEVRTDSTLFAALQITALAVAVANALLLWRLLASRVPDRAYWSAVLLLTSLPFLVRSSWLHSYAYLPLAQSFAFLVVLRTQRHPAISIGLVLLFLLPSALLSSLFFFHVVGNEDYYVRHAYVFWANLLLLLPLYWCGLGWLRGQARRHPASECVTANPVEGDSLARLSVANLQRESQIVRR
jgi:hypothetical protein